MASAAARVFAAAAYLHDISGVPTILAAIIVFAGNLTIAARMLALPVFISHACTSSLKRGGTNSRGQLIAFNARRTMLAGSSAQRKI